MRGSYISLKTRYRYCAVSTCLKQYFTQVVSHDYNRLYYLSFCTVMAQLTTTDLSDRLQSQLTGFEAGQTNQHAELEEYVN